MWRASAIDAGEPVVFAATSGEFVPQMLNLELLDGVSFDKGCYPGQEIVARTQYLGRIKRRMFALRVNSDRRQSRVRPFWELMPRTWARW